MSRRLILGRAGTGKTHACLDLLLDALKRGRRALLLVPTYSQSEHLRFLLLDRVPGIRGRLVETFSSLAESVAGVRLTDLAPPAERDLAAEAALLPRFPDAAGKPGFRAEFLAVVKEIKENGAEPAEAVAKAKAHFPEGSRGRLLFESFEHYRLGAPDHEDLLRLALARIRARPEPLDLLLVDGFHDFTGLERLLLEGLARAAGETVVTLPLDPDGSSPVFAVAGQTAAHFRDHERIALRGNRRTKAPALLHLERRLFEEPGAKEPAGGSVEWIECASEEDEADRLARLVLRSGRPFHDFLLVRRTFDGLFDVYRAAFRRHGVPLRFFTPEPLGATPAARAARLLCAALRGERREKWERLARNPWFRGDAEGLGERGGTLGEILARHLGVGELLRERPGGDFELARAAALFRLLAAEADAVKGLPLREAAARVEARIPLLQARVPDQRHDCVYAVEALDARQWEKPVVLAAGLGAEAFPRQVRQDLFLRDAERKEFQESRAFSLPLRGRREEEERYLFYVAMTRARERLVLSHAAFDEEGTGRARSPYLDEALLHLEGAPGRRVPLAEQYVQERDAVSRRDLFPLVADALSRAATGRAQGAELALAASLCDLGSVDRRELAFPRRLELARLTRVRGEPPQETSVWSASSAGDYLRCPYLYFAHRLLGVEPPRDRELDPRLRGEILHRTLETIFLTKEDPGGAFDRIWAEATGDLRLDLRAEAQRRWMRRAAIAAAEEMRAAEVAAVERKFEVELGGLRVRGRMDRVDRVEQGEVVRDYKSGEPPKRDIQLGIYLLALERPAGAIYELLRDGRRKGFVLKGVEAPKGVDSLSPEDFREELERARRTLLDAAARAREGRFAVRPAEPDQCARGRCDGFDLCRVARGRWLVKEGRTR